MSRYLILFIMLAWLSGTKAQDAVTLHYEEAYQSLSAMLAGQRPCSFKGAVYAVENAFHLGNLDSVAFEKEIHSLASLSRMWMQANRLKEYPYSDSLQMLLNGAVFTLMTDTIFFTKEMPAHLPFTYDFNDFFGDVDWRNMFVSKLLAKGSGNCHSLPYLYKILTEELGGKAWLAFAPGHVYIKQWSEQAGWYNTELTSAMFPRDAWILASGYMELTAMQSGLYTDTLSAKASIAACLVDLAQGYLKKKDSPGFPLRCANTALKHHPKLPNALLLRAEMLKRMYISASPEQKSLLYDQMNSAYGNLIRLGYRDIPQEAYLEWLGDLRNNPQKYQNSRLMLNFQPLKR